MLIGSETGGFDEPIILLNERVAGSRRVDAGDDGRRWRFDGAACAERHPAVERRRNRSSRAAWAARPHGTGRAEGRRRNRGRSRRHWTAWTERRGGARGA